MNKSIILLVGMAITILFIIFSTNIFEMFYYEREFSYEMDNQNLYVSVGIISVCMAWGISGIYYYLINSVSFSRWYHWLIMLLSVSVLTPVICYMVCNNVFDAEKYDFSSQLFNFVLRVFAVEVVLFIIASFSMRWWSSNCRHTPIPE